MKLPKKQSRDLVVDDEPDINMSFKLTLENAGFIVDGYHDPLIVQFQTKLLRFSCA